jgi:hypothetical protein
LPLIGAADDWAVAATARGPAIASAIASLQTWNFMETPIRVRGDFLQTLARRSHDVHPICILTASRD